MHDCRLYAPLSNTIAGVIIATLVATPTLSNAQNTESTLSKTTGSRTTGRDEIVVTARKREESLQEVPLSITAFTSQDLRDRNITNTYDLANATANFSMSRNLGRRLEAPTIRGQFGTLLNITGPNASFFVDGVYVSNTSSNLSSNYVERVEVLRGPQAALFGRSTFSGAINYITRKPGDVFAGEANFKAGQNDRYEASAWASGPLIDDTLFGFISGGFQTYGGEWRNNLQPGDIDVSNNPSSSQDFFNAPGVWAPNGGAPQTADFTRLGGEETIDFTGKLVWNIGEFAEITAKGEYIETDDDHFPALFVPIGNLNCFRPADGVSGFPGDPGAGVASPGWFCGELGPASTIPTKINLPQFRTGVTTNPVSGGPITSQPLPFIGTQTRTNRYLLQGVFDVNDWELTSRFGITDYHDEFVRDLYWSYALGPLATGLFEQYSIQDASDKSAEIRLASPTDKRFYGMLGYYYYEKSEVGIIRDLNGFGTRNIDGVNTAKFRRFTDTAIVNNALFGSITYEISEQWQASVDARYAKDTPEARTSPAIIEKQIGLINFEQIIAAENFYSLTPRFILKYQPTDDLNFYAQIAKGNKPGGFNTFQFFDADTAATDTLASLGENDCDLPGQADICGLGVIAEEEAWTYELGFKSTLFDGQLTLNSSAYYTDWTNQQVNIVVGIPTNCAEPPGPEDPNRNCVLQPNSIVANAGQSTVYGVEIEAIWVTTDNLTLSLAYGLAKSELEDFSSPQLASLRCPAECWETTIPGVRSPLTPEAEALRASLGSVDGNESPRSPKHQLNVAGSYVRAISSEHEWFLRSDVTYESKQWATVANLTHTGEPLTWNAWTGIRSDNWTLSFYIDNILDDDTSVLNNDFPLFDLSKATQRSNVPGLPITTPGPFFETVYPTGYLVTPRRGRNAGVTFQYSFGA